MRGGDLTRAKLTGAFDLSIQPEPDPLVAHDQIAVEIRFHWRGQWRHELHRYPFTILQTSDGRMLCDTGDEILPPLEIDE